MMTLVVDLLSLIASLTSSTYFSKPSCCNERAHVEIQSIRGLKQALTLRASTICSGFMVFLESLSQISWASEETRRMNSVERGGRQNVSARAPAAGEAAKQAKAMFV